MDARKLSVVLIAYGGVLVSDAVGAANQGVGHVTFDGSIVDAPCSIAPGSSRPELDMGIIQLVDLAESGGSAEVPFSIELTDCNQDWDMAHVTFSGEASDMGNYAFGMSSGATENVAINLWKVGEEGKIKLQNGKQYLFAQDVDMVAGRVAVPFVAALMGSNESVSGDFISIVYFAMSYE